MNKTTVSSLFAAIGLVAGLSGAHAATSTITTRGVSATQSAPNHDVTTKRAAHVFGVVSLNSKVLHCTGGGACG